MTDDSGLQRGDRVEILSPPAMAGEPHRIPGIIGDILLETHPIYPPTYVVVVGKGADTKELCKQAHLLEKMP